MLGGRDRQGQSHRVARREMPPFSQLRRRETEHQDASAPAVDRGGSANLLEGHGAFGMRVGGSGR